MYRNDKRDGHGRLMWNDGAYYVGNWKKDKRNGQGCFFHADGDMEEGEWKDGKLVQEKPNYKTLDPDANGLNTGEDSDEFGSIDPIKTKKGPDPNNNSEIHENNQIWDK